MQFFKLLAPAALVALASAQFYDDEAYDIIAREEAPGYDDLGVFIRDAEDKEDIFDLSTREAEGDFDAIIALAEREAEPDAEADAEADEDKPKKKKKGKKNKKGKKKGKKGKKNKKGKKKGKKMSKKQKKVAAKRRKQAKEDADIWA